MPSTPQEVQDEILSTLQIGVARNTIHHLLLDIRHLGLLLLACCPSLSLRKRFALYFSDLYFLSLKRELTPKTVTPPNFPGQSL